MNKLTERNVSSNVGLSFRTSLMRQSRYCLLLAAAFLPCLVAMVGWIFGIDSLKLGLNGQHMDFATALWLSLLTLACAPLILDFRPDLWQKLAVVALGIAAAFGLLTIIQTALNISFIPNPAVSSPFHGGTSLYFASLPIDISFCLIATSLAALALKYFGQKHPQLFQSISLLIALPASFLIIADLFGAADKIDVICAYQNCVRLQYLNYACLLMLNLAILFARPSLGLTSFLEGESAGSKQIKTSLFGILLIIPILWLFFTAKHYGVINEPAMIVLSLISAFITFFALLAYSARGIDKIDREKQATEQSLSEANAMAKLAVSYRMLCLECFKEYPSGTATCPDDKSSLSRMMESLAPGAVLNEKYEITEVIGFGGMSTVYKAKHLYLDTIVAIKLLNHQLASDAKAVQRFQAEAKAAHGLHHPNVLTVNDFGMSQEGQAYIVMDYLQGQSLADAIQQCKKLAVSRALSLFLDISQGLAHAHQSGVVHRDIKPGNIMLVTNPDGEESAKIVDFGLAKVFDENSLKLTQTGEVYGSPLYMSPEQCRGIAVDYKTDIYSFGVLMYETLAGVAPITGTTAYETFTNKLSRKPIPFMPSLAVPDELQKVILECLAVDASRRPASADVLTRRLQSVL